MNSEVEKVESTIDAPNQTPAEKEKKLGNEFFAKKEYDDAIVHYSEAIKLDPENAVFYSNRAACYASKAMWKHSLEDAVMCISKDSKFIKGYYRLATAQMELKEYDDSEATIRAALVLEPNNEILVKQLKTIKHKKTTEAVAIAKALQGRPQKELTNEQKKELQDLQEQSMTWSRDLRQVSARLNNIQRETRANQVTIGQVDILEETVPLYRSVGKAFVLSDKKSISENLETELSTLG